MWAMERGCFPWLDTPMTANNNDGWTSRVVGTYHNLPSVNSVGVTDSVKPTFTAGNAFCANVVCWTIR
jgi:hypothetical protein